MQWLIVTNPVDSMSDNEDALSDEAPAGWNSVFQGDRRGKSKSKDPKVPVSREQPSDLSGGETGWLGGWFGSPSAAQASKKSSISSDTPDAQDSGSDMDGNDDINERMKLGQEDLESDDGTDKDGSLHAFEVDSDGFPIGPDTKTQEVVGKSTPDSEVSGSSLDEDDIKNFEVDDVQMGEELPERKLPSTSPSSPRRERIRNRMNFTVTRDAAEIVLPDITVEGGLNEPADSTGAREVQGERNQATGGSGGEASPVVPWWQTFLPVGVAVSTSENPAESSPEVPRDARKDDKPPPQNDSSKATGEEGGLWSSMFGGGSKEPEPVDPRSVLPQIKPPPDIPALDQVNSYYTPVPMSQPAIELLGPRVITRFEGRLRGWPRGLAPYWSTHDRLQPERQSFSQNIEMTGVSTLAMFRVT
jgi:hypothetical protein